MLGLREGQRRCETKKQMLWAEATALSQNFECEYDVRENAGSGEDDDDAQAEDAIGDKGRSDGPASVGAASRPVV
jgi:hypothetical protein